MKIIVLNNEMYDTVTEELKQTYPNNKVELEWEVAHDCSDLEVILKMNGDCDIFAVTKNIPLNQLKKLLKRRKQVIMRTKEGWEQVLAVHIKTKFIS